jgi:hypothetical protein
MCVLDAEGSLSVVVREEFLLFCKRKGLSVLREGPPLIVEDRCILERCLRLKDLFIENSYDSALNLSRGVDNAFRWSPSLYARLTDRASISRHFL